ncbi:hypothetical protein [Labilibaculum sp.]|uniref:DUF7793 family protein n=1 Tax=Labilibaculum sp. TaxID=2060723 RepID=UPI002AA78047|nr:hypothetical protein [Labilibaculum sp.]MBN2597752.1 STAS/SEC14 domain-containing protein [Marinifilaceae bacterium]
MGNSYYTYAEEHKLLIECFCGETEIENVFELKNEIEANLSQVPKYSILVDIRKNTNKPFHKKDDDLTKFYSKSKSTLKIDSIAILTNTPNQVVNTTLFIEGLKKEFDMPIKIFSSLESAVKWLNTGIDLNKVKSILKEFKKRSV